MVSPVEAAPVTQESLVEVETPVEAPEGAAPEVEPVVEPAETPEPTPITDPALPQPSARETQLNEELNQSRQRLQAFEQEKQTREQAANEQQYIDAIESGQYTPQQIAQIVRQMHQRAVAAEQREQNVRKETEAKIFTATKMAQKYGVPIEGLMRYNSPEDMERAAEQSKELATLKAQVNKLTKDTVPAQKFDTGRGKGGAAVNADNIDLLHMQGQVSDDAYQTFLDTGKLP